ncbi:CDP-glycerol--glycerophosphate glycerophosphotransferase [Motilimonas eburnea]|nr:CDP-glycerol--glycerophosphate glycerophosphotransferase [Motilimonas eburnea]
MELGLSTKRYLFYIAQNYAYAMLRPLQTAILARGDQVYWFLEGNEVDPKHLKPNEQRWHSVAEVIAWQPDAVFVPGNVVPSFIPGLKVALFHGFDTGKRKSEGNKGHFAIRNCFDLYCTQGPSTTGRFQELAKQHGHFDVVETGWAALDPLFTPMADNPYLSQDGRKTVLMCSTFSKQISCARTLFDTVKGLMATGEWHWLIQFHPKMEPEVVQMYQALCASMPNAQFVETDNVLPLLTAADVMLCDTSSIVLMYLMLQKPVVTFNNKMPGPHLYNITQTDQVHPALTEALTHPADLMQGIRDYTESLHPYRDGHSSERVLAAVDGLLAKGTSHLKAKPSNLIRHLKMRKKLGYWKI